MEATEVGTSVSNLSIFGTTTITVQIHESVSHQIYECLYTYVAYSACNLTRLKVLENTSFDYQ